MQKVAIIDGLDLRRAPFAIGGRDYSPDLPPAALTEDGKRAQDDGAYPHASHYDEAPWQLSVLVKNPTPALLDQLITKFRAGALLTWGEGVDIRSTKLTSARLVNTMYRKNGALAIVTLAGTREVRWERLSTVELTGTVTGWGTYTTQAPEGDLCAPCDLLMDTPATIGLFGAAIMPNPADTYSPIDQTDRSNAAVGSAGYASIGAASTADVRGNRGPHHVVASVSTSNLGVSYRLASTLSSNTRYGTPVRPTALECVMRIDDHAIPSWPLPDVDLGEWAAAAKRIEQTSIAGGGLAYLASPKRRAYVFPVAQAMLDHLIIATTTGVTPSTPLAVELWTVTYSGGSYKLKEKRFASSVGASNTTVGLWPFIDMEGELPYLAMVFQGGLKYAFGTLVTGALIGEVDSPAAGTTVANTSQNHPYLITYTRERASWTQGVTLQAKADSGTITVSQWALARLYAGHGGFIATASFAAGTGIHFDPIKRAAYPTNDIDTVSGPSVRTFPFGEGFDVAPQVPNMFTFLGSTTGVHNFTLRHKPAFLDKA